MKKLLCLAITLVLAMSIFAGCGKTDENNAPNQNATVESGEPVENNAEVPENKDADKTEGTKAEEAPELTQPAPSTNKEVVTAEEAPEVYLVVGGDDNAASISYHLKGCKLLEGGESQKVAWEMIKTLGFRQCPECNPPQYEEYVE